MVRERWVEEQDRREVWQCCGGVGRWDKSGEKDHEYRVEQRVRNLRALQTLPRTFAGSGGPQPSVCQCAVVE